MTDKLQNIKAVILDWAGTTIDHGSRAPAAVFQEIFRQRGIPLTAAQARGPMGMAKREHLAAVASIPEIDLAWQRKYGRPCVASDIDQMYADFLPLQKSVLRDHCDMIPGVVSVIEELRQLGLKIGSTTGYTRELMEIVSTEATRQGYTPECIICAEDAVRGRPAPYLIYEAARRLDTFPLWEMVVVDDTRVGIAAGRNAGCWTIGVTRTGNGLGLSVDEVEQLPRLECERRCQEAANTLLAAGAHSVIESVAEIVPVIQEFDRRATNGEKPC